MDLKGNLSVFEPISVFQLVNLSQATGELELSVNGNKARIFFDDGSVVYAELKNKPMRLGEYLVEQKLVAQRDLEHVLKEKGRQQKLGTALMEWGLVEETALRTAVETQIKEVIYEAVRWRKGRFKFREGKQPKTQDIFINIPLDYLVLEGLKRMDEEGDGAQ